MTKLWSPFSDDGFTPPEREGWMVDAACASTDPGLFFPPRGGSAKSAKRICAGCEVRDECLAYALAHHEVQGVWGGLSAPERAVLAATGPRHPVKADPVRVVALLAEGLTAQVIAERLGVADRTVWRVAKTQRGKAS